jgi:hypothetical protein
VTVLSTFPGSAPAPSPVAADGTFTITGVPFAPVSLVGSAPDGRTSTPLPVDPAAATSGIELHVAEARHITGTIVDATGAPARGIHVEAAADEPRAIGAATTWDGNSTETDADGRYDLLVPTTGSYTVTALDASKAAMVADAQADPVVDLTIHLAQITGTVRNGAGDPVPDTTVNLVADGDTVSFATTDADGTYRLPAAASRSLSVWVGSAAVGLAHHDVTTPASGSFAVADLVPGTASLTVELSGPGGPVAGQLSLLPLVAGDTVPVPLSVTVGGTGTVTIDGLDPGSYQISGASPGLAVARATAATTATDPVPLSLGAEAPFATTIVDPGGAPVASAEVDLLRSDGGPDGGLGFTDATGHVTISGVAPGTYDLWIAGQGTNTVRVASGLVLEAPTSNAAPSGAAAAGSGLTAATRTPRPAATADIPATYTYDGAYGGTRSVFGDVSGPNGTGLGPNPPEVVARFGDRTVPVQLTPDGRFGIADPPDGAMVLEVRKDGYETKRYPLTMPADASTFQHLKLGLPLEAADKLQPIDDGPPLPSAAEAFAAFFDFVDPPERTSDPYMEVILKAKDHLNPCPNGKMLLARAKRAASLALAQNDLANQILATRYQAKWDRGWLFTLRLLDFGAAVISTAIPVAQALGKGIWVFKAVQDVAKLDLWRQAGATLLSLPIASMVSDLAGFIGNAYFNGDTSDFDPMIFLIKGTVDLAKVSLEFIRDSVADPTVPLDLGTKIARGLGATLSTLAGAWDAYQKAVAGIEDLQTDLALINNMTVSAQEASDLANRLENNAKRLYFIWLSQANGRTDCDQPKDLPGYAGGVGGAVDPNEIVGPTGQGADRWLAVPAGLGYEVHFENLGPGTVNPPPGVPLATSPAAEVVVRETVPATYDRSSFTFDDVGWGTHVIDVPDGVQSFTADEPITVEVDDAPVDLVVRVSGDYDPATGKATWRYRTLDPETGDIPLDPAEGFLPPEPGDETGQGWLRYSVSGADGVAAGTYLDATASITFDTNAPIDTNTWRNRVGTPGSTGEVCPANDSANGRFVCAAYRDTLGRAPDAAGKAHWLARLSGGTSRSAVAANLLSSTEGRRLAVRGIFDEYLDRAPDPSGLTYWVTTMGSGATRDSVRRSVLASSEYYRHHGSSRAGYVSGLYDDVYGRTADATGKAYWTKSLAAGRSRSSVARAFLFAPEGRRAVVRDVYDDYLGRSLAFTEADYWATRLARQNDETRFRSEVIGSPEYFSHA